VGDGLFASFALLISVTGAFRLFHMLGEPKTRTQPLFASSLGTPER
jgi:hypothetical protein